MKLSYTGKQVGGKLFRLHIELEQDRVAGFSVNGDFFAHPEEGFESSEQHVRGVSLNEVPKTFAAALQMHNVKLYGLTIDDIEDAVNNLQSRKLKV